MKLGTSRGLRTLFDGGSTAGLSDEQLLGRFANGGASAEAAFEALVGRHGPMVWGTCRRILRDQHEAEDAFQATFLLLARKARSIRVDDSLGRWLHGVGVRVAIRARAVADKRRGVELANLDPPAPTDRDTGDLRQAIDEEVDRLPATYRSVVVLCHLEGLTRELAASRLGCPVGTVNSRLSRAGEILRSRLTRRGLAPLALTTWLASTATNVGASSPVPIKLAESTARLATGGWLAGTVPVGVAMLVRESLRRMAMIAGWKIAALGSTLIALVGFAAAGSSGPIKDDAKATKPADPPAKPPSPLERFKAIEAEWKAANAKCLAEMTKGKDKAEQSAAFAKHNPNELDYYRRCLDLADATPDDPGARQAWLFVVTDGMRNSDSVGERAGLIRKAVDGLIAHHSNDSQVLRTADYVARMASSSRMAFARGLFEKASGHEAKGLASLALAHALFEEANWVKWAHANNEVQSAARYMSSDESGKPITLPGPMLFDDTYWKFLRAADESAIRTEAEALYNRVIAEYADIPFDPWKYEGTKVVKNPTPKSLAQVAEERLDDIFNVAVGKPAPEIDGVDLDGKPLKLADYRGKVVVLVFWFAGCGPCIASIPAERELADRYKDRPFAILAVNSDESLDAAKKAVEQNKIPWPSWKDGTGGPIIDRYHIKGFPSVFVIDAKGVIRVKQTVPHLLDKVLDDLVKEAESKTP